MAIVEAVLGFAQQHIADRYLQLDRRKAALAQIGGIGRAILERTDDATSPGLRLVAVRAVIGAAFTLDEIGDLRACLESGSIPEGLPLDPDLRWRILLRLSILSATDPSDIEAELSSDTSGAGPERAARCRAALPRLAAKRAAWDLVFGTVADTGHDTEQTSSHLVTATMEGFWQLEQRTLLAPFIELYFPAAVELVTRRGAAVAGAVAAAGFPFHAITESTARAAERCLTSDDVPASLRRILVDQLDDYRRALRVRGQWDMSS